MDKSELRKDILKIRRGLTSDDTQRYGLAAAGRLKELPQYREARYILAYMSTQGEVPLIDFISDALADGKRVYIPRVESRESMEFYLYDKEALAPGSYGIEEPQNISSETRYVPHDKTMIVVPGVAYDRQGYRLGYGGGYYDRFVAALRDYTEPYLIGVAYSFQLLEQLPVQEHDIKMDRMIVL